MKADFPRSLRLVLIDEGGLDDDPHDHGGRTAHGIIQREYNSYRDRMHLARQDVWKITAAEYTAIYHDSYWTTWCDKLPAGLDYVFFDACVNAGPVAATKLLQKTLGVLRPEGHMGQITLDAVQAETDKDAGIESLIHRFCEKRRAFYRSLAQFPRYGRGWLARVDHVERCSKEIAAGYLEATRNGLNDELKTQASARAKAENAAKPPVSTETATTVATGSGIGGSILGKLQEVGSAFEPLRDSLQFVEYLLIALAVVSAGFAIYGMLHNKQTQEATA